MTTAEAAVATLIGHGIKTVFGVPGVHNDPFFDALHGEQARIRILHARHEQTAGYMALGAALATGRPSPFVVVPGPGLLNASASLLTAYGMGAPVLALAGQIPSFALERGFGHLHEIRDQLGLLGHLTKHAARVAAPYEAGPAISRAIQLALSGRPGPVALEVPIDVWPRSGPAAPGAVLPVERPPVDEDAVARAVKILGAAERPLIVVGGGAQDASAEVQRIAELLEAPVVSYRRGRGVIPTAHRLAVSYPVGHRLWRDADAVLAIGTRLYVQQADWGHDAALKIIRVDIDPEEPGRLRSSDCAVLGDAAEVLRALLAKLPGASRARPSREEELARHRAWFDAELAVLEPQMGFLRAMRAALPEDGILVDEVTQVGFVARLAFPVLRPRSFFSGYQDNLGYGYGTALGAKAACPDRAVLSIAGDGGFAYQAMELATAKRHNLAVVVVVFDDGAFGNVRRIQQEQYGNRLIASDLTNPDFVRFAESFGIAAFRARTDAELERALREAFALDAPALVHVPVGEMPSHWKLILMPRQRGTAARSPMP
ncbi:MAG TPA: thiamine pyrophosphate-dependent enzyme [Acetobacteraceae bacterium]|nr:thiamine pyrophosphate-dependent enzyme [Acetobacteraceae bacterium]